MLCILIERDDLADHKRHYKPTGALVNKDPRMKAVLKMRAAGFEYNHPDEVENDVRKRLEAILAGETPLAER